MKPKAQNCLWDSAEIENRSSARALVRALGEVFNLKPNNQKGKPMSSKRIRVLAPRDRCDKCNAPARIALQFKSGELMFCGHCFTANSEALKIADPLISATDEQLLDCVR